MSDSPHHNRHHFFHHHRQHHPRVAGNNNARGGDDCGVPAVLSFDDENEEVVETTTTTTAAKPRSAAEYFALVRSEARALAVLSLHSKSATKGDDGPEKTTATTATAKSCAWLTCIEEKGSPRPVRPVDPDVIAATLAAFRSTQSLVARARKNTPRNDNSNNNNDVEELDRIRVLIAARTPPPLRCVAHMSNETAVAVLEICMGSGFLQGGGGGVWPYSCLACLREPLERSHEATLFEMYRAIEDRIVAVGENDENDDDQNNSNDDVATLEVLLIIVGYHFGQAPR